MNKPPLRIGVWFQENHAPYGGPSVVLLGTLLGLYQYAEEIGVPIIVLLNERGDVNWSLGLTSYPESDRYKLPDMWYGPACFAYADAEIQDYKSNQVWQTVHNALFPSAWFRAWVSSGLPFDDPERNEGRKSVIWAAGVDTEFFSPASEVEKTQDYFIYFKSQNTEHLHQLLKYFFENWFGLRGTVLSYYNYDPAMLRDAARRSKFCIMLDNAETQGLASLEIMATGCPLFVIDIEEYKGKTKICKGASSVPCWNGCCGMKSSLSNLSTDFPKFIEALSSYKPRIFAELLFSHKVAAGRLFHLITGKHHQSKDNKEEDNCVEEKT